MNLFFLREPLPNNKQAVFVHKDLISYDPNSHEYTRIGYQNSDYKWDCFIAISGKWCDRRDKYPACFAYLIGHELGHAKVCLSDRCLHIHCCLIQSNIKRASFGKIKYCHELPHEKLFDKFGKFLAHKFFKQENLIMKLRN